MNNQVLGLFYFSCSVAA